MDPELVPTPAPATKPTRSLHPLLSALVVILVITSAFLNYQNMQLKKQLLALQTTPSPTPPITPSISESNLYTRIEGFSFEIPSRWTEQKNYSLLSDDKLMEIWLEGEFIEIHCAKKMKETTKTIDNRVLQLEYYSEYADSDICKGWNPNKRFIFISFDVNGKKYHFLFVYFEDNTQEAEKILDQILSTFKFLSED